MAVWIRALRLYSITASLVPVLFGGLVVWRARDAHGPWLWALALIGGVLLHLGTNLINDVGDYRSGVDRAGTSAGSGVLVEKLLTDRQLELAAWLCFGLAALIGVALIAARGPAMAALGIAGLAGGWAYTAGPKYKYAGLGDPAVFLLMGPLMALGGALALTGSIDWRVALDSLPIALLVTSIIHANNLRDLEDDAASGVRTVAIALGRNKSVTYFALLNFGSYAALVALALARLLPWPALLAALSLPLAIALSRDAARSVSRESRRAAHLVERTAQLHLAFGVLLIAGTGLSLAL